MFHGGARRRSRDSHGRLYETQANDRRFGASIAWVAIDLKNFSAADQTTILDALYSTSKPSAGLSVVRAGSMLCEFNPSPGVYDWNHVLIQDEMSWMNRGCRTPAPRWARK